MNASVADLADTLAQALDLMPCACRFNVPYAGGAVEQVVTVQCARCRALQAYEAAGYRVKVQFNRAEAQAAP